MSQPTTKNVTAKGAKETTLVVVLDGREIGLVVTWKGRGHPSKAYSGIGADAKFLYAYYPKAGGTPAAVREVVRAAS